MRQIFIIFIIWLVISGVSYAGCCDKPWFSVPERPAPDGWCAIPEPFILGNYLAAKLPAFFKGNLDTPLSQVYIQGPIDISVYQTGVKWDSIHLNFLGSEGFEYYSEANNKVEMLVKRITFPDEIYGIFNLGIIVNTVFPLPEGVKSIGHPMLSEDGLSVLMFDLSQFSDGYYSFKVRWHGTPWWGKWSKYLYMKKTGETYIKVFSNIRNLTIKREEEL